MSIGSTWERYFLKEIAKTTLFFLLAFFTLYSLVDYSSHAASFHHNQLQFSWKDTGAYYLSTFIQQINILLPFALLIALIRALCTLNAHNELIALMSSGISLMTLMRPFLFFGLLCTCYLYFNTEVLQPLAMHQIVRVEKLRSSKKHKQMEMKSVQHLSLGDGSTIVFHHFDHDRQAFFDAYWVRNIDNIYHMKYLEPALEEKAPVGHFVDHFTRDADHQLIVAEQFAQTTFPEMVFNKELLFDTVIDPDRLPLSDLWKKLPGLNRAASEKESQVLAAFYHKLIIPWLCLLVVIGTAPFCIRFTRNLPVFLIYAGGVFSLVTLNLIITTGVTLAERQVLPPLLVIGVPFALIASLLLWRFSRINNPCS